jgi:tetratricopeptide (TPR) repeat protein
VFSLRLLRDIRAFVVGVVVGVAALSPAAARATEPDAPLPPGAPAATPMPPTVDAAVERHAMLGQRLLSRGEAQDAIAEFRRAYELRADARFLADIAEGYRQLGLRDQAIFFYERYLAAAPDAPDREDIEEDIATLRRPTTPAVPVAPSPNAVLGATLGRDVVVIPVAPVASAAPRPLWRRWWAWAALGALVAGGLATTFAFSREGTDVPATALGDKKFY